MTSVEPPDRATILAAVMPALLAVQAPTVDVEPAPDDRWGSERHDGATAADTVVATRERVVVGTSVAREAFGRLGARFRPLVDDGGLVAAGDVVADVGGPAVAIRRAAPVALAFLDRLSAVASGARPPDRDDPLEVYAAAVAASLPPAARLSPSTSVDDDGRSFRLGSEG
ncbi:MAG TPA: hypothetical protein VLA82_07185 [Actinomycetota bacterium]|nr:hypothetical protein [Actinomycetota bacterium]